MFKDSSTYIKTEEARILKTANRTLHLLGKME